MADFSALKQSIETYIKNNGNKEITGAILQNILLSMVTTMGDGAINDNASDISDIKGDIQNINGDITDINGDITDLNGDLSDEINRAEGAETTTVIFSDGKLVFKNAAGTVLYQLSVDSFLSAITTRLNTGALYAGYATPSTTPAALTSQEVFYLATQAGTYTNFHFNGGDDPIVLTKDGIYFIVSGTDDDDWNAEPMLQLDDVPTAGSDNPVKSGGVAEELALGAVYDVSAKNPTAGPNSDGKWESLSALLSDANLSTLIPASVRKGGMSIKFVQSSDNKYVQYRLMSDTFNTIVTNWQGVDDEPIAGSDNLVKSGGVFSGIENKTTTASDVTIKLGAKNKVIMPNGAVSPLSGYNISAPISVKKGEIVDGHILSINSATAPIAFSEHQSVSQNSYTVLALPNLENGYARGVAPSDGFVFISYNASYLPNDIKVKKPVTDSIVEIKEELAYDDERLSELEKNARYKTDITPIIARTGYYIDVNGNITSYSQFALCQPISVKKGDIIVAEITGINVSDAPFAFNQSDSLYSEQYTILAKYDSSDKYYVQITSDGYLFVSINKDYVPTISLYRLYDKTNYFEKNVLAIWGTTGYIATDGSSGTYRIDGVSVISKMITVKKGDRIKVTISNGVNSAAAPISFSTERESSSSAPVGHYTPLCVYDSENANYEGIAPNDGYIFLTYNPNTTTFVKIIRQRTYSDAPIWLGKKWFCVGDSLTDDNQRSSLKYHDYIADKTCIQPYNIGVSGSGYKRLEENNFAFYQRCLIVENDTDIVTIFGSFNDTSYAEMGYSSLDDYIGVYTDQTTDTIAGCINTVISNIVSINPLIKIAIIAPTPWDSARPVQSVNGEKYVTLLKQVAEYNSIPFLDLFHYSGLMPWLSSVRTTYYSKDEGSGVHPNEAGNKVIASHIKEFIESII